MSFSGVIHGESVPPERGEDTVDGLDTASRDRYVVSEQVDVSAFSTKIRLHVDYNESGIVASQISVERPWIWNGCDVRHQRTLDTQLSRPAVSIGFHRCLGEVAR
jgi:hypothetical protein